MGLWGQHSLMPSGESFQKKHVELGFVIIESEKLSLKIGIRERIRIPEMGALH